MLQPGTRTLGKYRDLPDSPGTLRARFFPQKQIPARCQCTHLAVRNAALQHPEATIGMDVAYAPGAEYVRGVFQTARDQVRRFRFRYP